MGIKIFWNFFIVTLTILLIMLVLLTVIMPQLIVIDILLILGIVFCSKKKKQYIESNNKIEKELKSIGYKKICNEIYINETEYKVYIKGKIYGFSDIKDCDLQIHDNNIFVNILVNDLEQPNIKLLFFSRAKSENIISLLKVVIEKGKEKIFENANITMVEHKYITQETATMQIDRLFQLYKDGVLSEYEFETKKKELLDKVK